MEERGSLGEGGEEIYSIYHVYDVYLGGVGEDILYILIILLEQVGRSVEVERNDSGVGSDSGHSGSAKAGETKEVVQVITTFDLLLPKVSFLQVVCPDCELAVVEGVETICAKCVLRRGERKEIITEIVETEGKYGRDLKIIVEEFYRPMLVAGLLSSDQLASIFLNVEQLIQVGNTKKTFNIEKSKKTFAGEHLFLPTAERGGRPLQHNWRRRVDRCQRGQDLHPGHAYAPG